MLFWGCRVTRKERRGKWGREGSWCITNTFLLWGHVGGIILWFWGVKPYVGPMGWPSTAAAQQGWDRRTGFGGEKVSAPAGPQRIPGPALPPSPVVPDAWGSAFSKLTASYLINMEDCHFINPLLPFRVNRKSSLSM